MIAGMEVRHDLMWSFVGFGLEGDSVLLALLCANYLLCRGCRVCIYHNHHDSLTPPPKQSQGARTVPKVLPSAYTIKQARFTLHVVVVDKTRATQNATRICIYI